MKQIVNDIFEKKMFRSNIIEEFQKKENKTEDFKLKMIESQHTFLLLNAFIFSVYFSRGKTRLVQFNNIFGSLTYTHACVTLYGEKIEFDLMMRRQNILGFYLRSRYVEKFPLDN